MLTIIGFSFELQRDACSVFVILHNLSCFTRGCLTDALTFVFAVVVHRYDRCFTMSYLDGTVL